MIDDLPTEPAYEADSPFRPKRVRFPTKPRRRPRLHPRQSPRPRRHPRQHPRQRPRQCPCLRHPRQRPKQHPWPRLRPRQLPRQHPRQPPSPRQRTRSGRSCATVKMKTLWAHGFSQRPRFEQVVGYLERSEPLPLDQPDRKATTFVTSHFYLDDFVQSSENPNPQPLQHTP